jgi:hypothetical protein
MNGRGAAASAAALAVALAACGGSSEPPAASSYTPQSIRAGFVKPADVGQNAFQIEDTEHSNHIIYTPTDSVPTCPYVQRADDVKAGVQAALELDGGDSTGRFIVGPRDPLHHPLPVVTQGAVVFKSAALADAGMKKVDAAAARCPNTFTILGGPPEIIGSYTVNQRPLQVAGWTGFSQQLAHTSPPAVDPETYDDLATIVLRKGNAILYAGFATIKQVGQRADSAATAQKVMQQTLTRLASA